MRPHLAAAAGPAGRFAASARAASPAELVVLAGHVVADAAERPAGLPAPQCGSPPLPLTATVCFPIAKERESKGGRAGEKFCYAVIQYIQNGINHYWSCAMQILCNLRISGIL